MVASHADPVIARVFGGVVIRSDTAPGPASYDEAGQRFVFIPHTDDSAPYAIDVESRSTQVPPFLAEQLGPSDTPFFERWTRLEVVAKLTDTPVLELVKRSICNHMFNKLISIHRLDTQTHWIAVGKRHNPGSQR